MGYTCMLCIRFSRCVPSVYVTCVVEVTITCAWLCQKVDNNNGVVIPQLMFCPYHNIYGQGNFLSWICYHFELFVVEVTTMSIVSHKNTLYLRNSWLFNLSIHTSTLSISLLSRCLIWKYWKKHDNTFSVLHLEAPFTKIDALKFGHGEVITSVIICGM